MIWSPWCPRDSQESFLASQFKRINSSELSLLYGPTFTSIHNYQEKNGLDYMDLFGKVMSRLCNMLSQFVIAFLSRTKHLLISSLPSAFAEILEPKKINSVTVSIFSPFAMNDAYLVAKLKPGYKSLQIVIRYGFLATKSVRKNLNILIQHVITLFFP